MDREVTGLIDAYLESALASLFFYILTMNVDLPYPTLSRLWYWAHHKNTVSVFYTRAIYM